MEHRHSTNDVFDTLMRQLSSFWKPDDIDIDRLKDSIESSYDATVSSWASSNRPYFQNNGFSIYNASLYSTFLCYLAHHIGTLWQIGGGTDLADRIYYLNKTMHNLEMYWNVDIPRHFIVDHPIGSVIGKGKIEDYFSIYQGVTVGATIKDGDWVWPTIGHHVTMYSHSSIIGNSQVGNYVIFSINSCAVNETIPDNSIVFGQSPNLIVKSYTEEEIKKRMVKEWLF